MFEPADGMNAADITVVLDQVGQPGPKPHPQLSTPN